SLSVILSLTRSGTRQLIFLNGDVQQNAAVIGCPPGIRTPIDRFRADCPTIERGGNRFIEGAADVDCSLPSRVYEVEQIRSTCRALLLWCVFSDLSACIACAKY